VCQQLGVVTLIHRPLAGPRADTDLVDGHFFHGCFSSTVMADHARPLFEIALFRTTAPDDLDGTCQRTQ
jgi:hypothetical protein